MTPYFHTKIFITTSLSGISLRVTMKIGEEFPSMFPQNSER